MIAIPYSSEQASNRYSVAIFDVLGNIAVDVQKAANSIYYCKASIKEYAKGIPFATAVIYRLNRHNQAIPVKSFNALETQTIINK